MDLGYTPWQGPTPTLSSSSSVPTAYLLRGLQAKVPKRLPPLPPAILFYLGTHHLGRKDLLSCLRVSRAWHQGLEPALWYEMTLFRDEQEQAKIDVLEGMLGVPREIGFRGVRGGGRGVGEVVAVNMDLDMDVDTDGQVPTRQSSRKPSSPRRPSSASLVRNAHHIRRLWYMGGDRALLLELIPLLRDQLEFLEVFFYCEGTKYLLNQNRSTLQTFICRADPWIAHLYRRVFPPSSKSSAKNRVEITANAHVDSDVDAGAKKRAKAALQPLTVVIDKVWQCLAQMPRLRSVELEGVIVSDYEGKAFGRVCHGLEKLCLRDSKLIERPKRSDAYTPQCAATVLVPPPGNSPSSSVSPSPSPNGSVNTPVKREDEAPVMATEVNDFPRLRTLILDRSYVPNEDKELSLFQMCPAMEHLTWKIRSTVTHPTTTTTTPILNFLFFLKSGACTTSLCRLDLSGSRMLDKDFVNVVSLLPAGVKEFTAVGTLFGWEATKALLDQEERMCLNAGARKGRLEGLNLLECDQFKAGEAQEVMERCLALKVFKAKEISAIQMGLRKWRCLGLEVFEIGIQDLGAGGGAGSAPGALVEGQGQQQQHQQHYQHHLHQGVYSQLGALTRLRSLKLTDLGHVTAFSTVSTMPDRLDFKLEKGLSHLARLDRLQELDVVGLQLQMEFLDLQWLVQHWRGLKVLIGSVHPNVAQKDLSNEFLRDQLKELKVFGSREEKVLDDLRRGLRD